MLSADADVALSLLNLRKSFGELEAVRDLSLDVFRGEVFGFLGPNGAGKTTTIRMICGLLRADGGEIRVNGAATPGERPRLPAVGSGCAPRSW